MFFLHFRENIRHLWQALHIKFRHILKSETRKFSAERRSAVDYYIIVRMIYLPLTAYQLCRGMTRNDVYAVIIKILPFIVGTKFKQFIKSVLGYLLAFSEISKSCVHKNESLISYVYCFISVKAVNEVDYFTDTGTVCFNLLLRFADGYILRSEYL